MKLTKDDVNRFVDKRGWSDDDEYIKLSRLREVVKELEKDFKNDIDLFGKTYCLGKINQKFGEVLE